MLPTLQDITKQMIDQIYKAKAMGTARIDELLQETLLSNGNNIVPPASFDSKIRSEGHFDVKNSNTWEQVKQDGL